MVGTVSARPRPAARPQARGDNWKAVSAGPCAPPPSSDPPWRGGRRSSAALRSEAVRGGVAALAGAAADRGAALAAKPRFSPPKGENNRSRKEERKGGGGGGGGRGGVGGRGRAHPPLGPAARLGEAPPSVSLDVERERGGERESHARSSALTPGPIPGDARHAPRQTDAIAARHARDGTQGYDGRDAADASRDEGPSAAPWREGVRRVRPPARQRHAHLWHRIAPAPTRLPSPSHPPSPGGAPSRPPPAGGPIGGDTRASPRLPRWRPPAGLARPAGVTQAGGGGQGDGGGRGAPRGRPQAQGRGRVCASPRRQQ